MTHNGVQCSVSELRQGEENEGPLESTDIFVHGRGIGVLVNVPVGNVATYYVKVDDTVVRKGAIDAGVGAAVLETADGAVDVSGVADYQLQSPPDMDRALVNAPVGTRMRISVADEQGGATTYVHLAVTLVTKDPEAEP